MKTVCDSEGVKKGSIFPVDVSDNKSFPLNHYIKVSAVENARCVVALCVWPVIQLTRKTLNWAAKQTKDSQNQVHDVGSSAQYKHIYYSTNQTFCIIINQLLSFEAGWWET